MTQKVELARARGSATRSYGKLNLGVWFLGPSGPSGPTGRSGGGAGHTIAELEGSRPV